MPDQYIYADSAVKLRQALFSEPTGHGDPRYTHPLATPDLALPTEENR